MPEGEGGVITNQQGHDQWGRSVVNVDHKGPTKNRPTEEAATKRVDSGKSSGEAKPQGEKPMNNPNYGKGNPGNQP